MERHENQLSRSQRVYVRQRFWGHLQTLHDQELSATAVYHTLVQELGLSEGAIFNVVHRSGDDLSEDRWFLGGGGGTNPVVQPGRGCPGVEISLRKDALQDDWGQVMERPDRLAFSGCLSAPRQIGYSPCEQEAHSAHEAGVPIMNHNVDPRMDVVYPCEPRQRNDTSFQGLASMCYMMPVLPVIFAPVQYVVGPHHEMPMVRVKGWKHAHECYALPPESSAFIQPFSPVDESSPSSSSFSQLSPSQSLSSAHAPRSPFGTFLENIGLPHLVECFELRGFKSAEDLARLRALGPVGHKKVLYTVQHKDPDAFREGDEDILLENLRLAPGCLVYRKDWLGELGDA